MHKPGRHSSAREPHYFGTTCAGCNKPLRRVAKGKWVTVKLTPLPDFRSQPSSPENVETARGENGSARRA
ncbi:MULTISPECIES: hypothetical protein [unclassified Novosphingobium]|uniref:hypothetical protein n=1 Tax=unclassified Novosphingobium TaxID=2644732 RepID=UPI0025F372EA|nr:MULTISPECIES: hypothetical protein [unclassified Novosphingobium]